MSLVSSPISETPTNSSIKMEHQKHQQPQQKGYTKFSEPQEDGKEALPIVELKPFVKKVWRREKSLPAFYDHYEQMRIARIMDSIPPTPPMPPPERIELYNLEMQKEKKHGDSANSPRNKSKAQHPPPVETKAPKQIEHSQSILPGFITRKERSKSTLHEIQCSEAPSKVSTGLQQSLNRTEIDKPPMINLNDSKVSKSSSKRSLQFIHSFRNLYHRHNGWSQSNSDLGFQPHQQNSFGFSRADERSRNSTPFYDTFDRKGTLPSINISFKTLKKRVPREKLGLDDLYEGPGASPLHKVGGISNSLHVLSKIGEPTQIEKNLSTQLKIDLRKFRKSRNYYFPFDMTPYELAKYYPPNSVSLTQGEIELRKGLQSNASKRTKRTREKSYKSVQSAPDKLITSESALPSPRADEIEDADTEVIRITGYAGEVVRHTRSGDREKFENLPTQADDDEDIEVFESSASPTKRTRSSKRVRTTTLVTLIPMANPDSPVSSDVQQTEDGVPTASSDGRLHPGTDEEDDIVSAGDDGQTREDVIVEEVEEEEDDEESQEDIEKRERLKGRVADLVAEEEGAPDPDLDGEEGSRIFLTSGHSKVRPDQDESL